MTDESLFPGAGGTCDSERCEEELVLEPPTIMVNQTEMFCSPDCVSDFFVDTVDSVEVIGVLNPGSDVNKSSQSDSANHSANATIAVSRDVRNCLDANIALNEILEQMAIFGEFKARMYRKSG